MMTVILITCVMARGKDGAFASNWVATRIIFAPSRSFSSAWGFFNGKIPMTGLIIGCIGGRTEDIKRG